MLKGNEIRKLYLDYFEKKRQHTVGFFIVRPSCDDCSRFDAVHSFSLAYATTVLQMVFEAHANLLFLDGIGCYWDIASPYRVQFMNQFQYGFNGIPVTVRTVILPFPFVNSSRLEYPGEWFSRDTDTWIGLAVLE